jgi:hypothetical protein
MVPPRDVALEIGQQGLGRGEGVAGFFTSAA